MFTIGGSVETAGVTPGTYVMPHITDHSATPFKETKFSTTPRVKERGSPSLIALVAALHMSA